MKGGAIAVASVVRTLAKLESPPPPPRNSRESEHTESHRFQDMVDSALQILHSAPVDVLDPLAEELVEVALHKNEDLHEHGRKLLTQLNEAPRQKATDKVVNELLGAANETAAPLKVESYTELLTTLHQGQPQMLHRHTEELVRLSASGHSGADVASSLLPRLENDAAIFNTFVEQLNTLQDTDTDCWCPKALLKTLQLMGKLDPVELSKHHHAWLFFQRCLLHPSAQVRLTFDVEMFSKESWTGALLAPHAALLLEAMGNQTMDSPDEDKRQLLRQSLARILARISEADLKPHVASLRGLMEREDGLKVQQEMIKLPRPILAKCASDGPLAETNCWLTVALADSSDR